ncbi:NACHT domain-containing protein [Streptomyces sp. S3(2020)]|uniref:HEAT repeat domain-containing protein n=1 Tax=Streptomyces sp. S3(2020) TaxID=2732044 RepID=UPI0014898EF4|nr:HEAT repeat domain-containing protein [Streptomyces sp. S3(2020)]NNN36913.1 NACHT domain-containing protein [Streptomyces sp. S3(2020)]
MSQILIAHADGDEALAAAIARPLEVAGYQVVHHGSLFVGDSLMQKASQAISQGSPVVLCGTVRAIGTGWAHFLVNAARRYGEARIFALQMEENVYLDSLILDGRIARYWQDPAGAIAELVAALAEYYPVRRPAGAEQRLDRLEQRYRELALDTCDIVDLANFPIGDRDLITRNLQLRTLYVSLRVAVDIPSGTEEYELEKKLQSLEARRKEHDAQDTRSRFSVGERLAQSNRLVVLGDPGAGKSTLLRWIATAYLLRLKEDPDWSQLPDVDTLPDANWLPLFIRCRDLDRRRLTGSLEDMIRHHLCDMEFSSDEAAELTPLLLGRLREGRVLLLIDGLDEISDPALRARFCRKVEKIHVAYPKASIIVTSRIVGYREMGLRITRGFEHLTVQDLTPGDKDDFARRWCEVTEPVGRRELAAEHLVGDIHSTDRIERLTGSPMLLTTMALVKKKVGKLPSRRADLYREAVDVLLHWRSDVDERMDPHEALPQLQYLAYSMCASGDQQIRRDRILDILERMRREFPAVRAVRQRSAVEFLRRLERQTGILVESGHVGHDGDLVPVYEFRHLTFQEYLAGLALVAGRYPGRNRRTTLAEQIGVLAAETAPFPGYPNQHEVVVAEKWREAIRLSVMTCNDDDVDGVLRAIATPLTGEESALTARARAALACACLADEPNVSEEVAAEILARFVATLTARDGNGSALTVADTALAEVGGSQWAAPLSRMMATEWVRDPAQYPRLAGSASVVLGRTAPSGDEAMRSWVRNQVALLKEPRPEVATEAALALLDVAYHETLMMVPGLVPGLMSMLSRGSCEATAAAWALGWAKMSHDNAPWKPSSGELEELANVVVRAGLRPETVMHLLWCFDEVPPSRRRGMAEAAMTAFVSADADRRKEIFNRYLVLFPELVDPVVAATSHHRREVRRDVAFLLRELNRTLALEPLLGVLTDEDGVAHPEVVRALAELGDARAVEPLLGVVRTPRGDADTSVVEALGSFGDPRAVEPLLDILISSRGGVDPDVVRALGRLRDPRAVQPLLEVLPTADEGARHAVVDALGRLRALHAVEPLLDLLIDSDGVPDLTVAMNLGLLGDGRAVDPLLDALTDADSYAYPAIVRALGHLRDRRAVDPLLTALADVVDDPEPYDDDPRLEIVEALARIGDPRVAPALKDLPTGESWELGFAVSAALALFGESEAGRTLHEAMADDQVEKRCAALWSLARLEIDEVDRALLSRDHDGLAPGVDPEEEIREGDLRRCAAAVHLPLQQVRARYEQLADRYPIQLSWHP